MTRKPKELMKIIELFGEEDFIEEKEELPINA